MEGGPAGVVIFDATGSGLKLLACQTVFVHTPRGLKSRFPFSGRSAAETLINLVKIPSNGVSRSSHEPLPSRCTIPSRSHPRRLSCRNRPQRFSPVGRPRIFRPIQRSPLVRETPPFPRSFASSPPKTVGDSAGVERLWARPSTRHNPAVSSGFGRQTSGSTSLGTVRLDRASR